MTEYKKYYAGEQGGRWGIDVVIYQSRDNYKFVISDNDDDMYLATNYVTPATANDIERTIDNIMEFSARYESIADVYEALQKAYYGSLFYLREKIAPQPTDGVLLLSIAE